MLMGPFRPLVQRHGVTDRFTRSEIDRIAFHDQGRRHLLAICRQGLRRDDETSVDRRSRSALHDMLNRAIVIPAGQIYRDWCEPVEGYRNTRFDAFCTALAHELFRVCRAVKQSLAQPPHKYHRHRRIEHAGHLLGPAGSSVTEVGLTVGYRETSSFTAALHTLTGLTPRSYRRALLRRVPIEEAAP